MKIFAFLAMLLASNAAFAQCEAERDKWLREQCTEILAKGGRLHGLWYSSANSDTLTAKTFAFPHTTIGSVMYLSSIEFACRGKQLQARVRLGGMELYREGRPAVIYRVDDEKPVTVTGDVDRLQSESVRLDQEASIALLRAALKGNRIKTEVQTVAQQQFIREFSLTGLAAAAELLRVGCSW
jgi:hypothetical protein